MSERRRRVLVIILCIHYSELEKKKEAKQREREAREREARKREKAEEKERRRQEYQAQMAALAAKEQQKKKNEEKKKKNGQAAGETNVTSFCLFQFFKNVFSFLADKKAAVEPVSKPRRSLIGLMFKLLLLLMVGLAGAVAACRLTDLQKEAACVPINVAVDDGLAWAKVQGGVVRQLALNLSSAAKELLESASKS